MRDMLTAVLGSLEQLHQQSLDEQGRHQLARAEAAALRAIDLLNRYAPLSDPDRQDGYKAEQSRCWVGITRSMMACWKIKNTWESLSQTYKIILVTILPTFVLLSSQMACGRRNTDAQHLFASPLFRGVTIGATAYAGSAFHEQAQTQLTAWDGDAMNDGQPSITGIAVIGTIAGCKEHHYHHDYHDWCNSWIAYKT
jgi:hypothetical protein